MATVRRYSPFDLYAMGLLAEAEVPRAFYVQGPSGASQDRESAPRTGVSFTGTRREVSVGDVVAAMGPRNPPAASAPRAPARRAGQAWALG